MVGGTGLYVRAVIDGLCPAPPSDLVYRRVLAQEAQAVGVGSLYDRLLAADPLLASRIHPHDARRIIRGLEVYRASGQPLSRWQAQTTGVAQEWDVRQVGLLHLRPRLLQRIDTRVERMMADGLVDEARAIWRRGVSRTASQALGYKQLFAAFADGHSLDGMVPLIQRDTRRYAKRQMTWFRHDPRITWVTPEPDEPAVVTAQRLVPLLAD